MKYLLNKLLKLIFSCRFPGCRNTPKLSYLPFDLRDNSPGKSSINAAEEQSSSLSEQAWDSYQEKYLSEAYSEAHDSDAARRLLEFGEDYRNFLGSQSDWSQSTNPEFSPSFRRKILPHQNNLDSDDDDDDVDDDAENMRKLLQESRESLVCTRGAFRKQFAMGLMEQVTAGNEIVILIILFFKFKNAKFLMVFRLKCCLRAIDTYPYWISLKNRRKSIRSLKQIEEKRQVGAGFLSFYSVLGTRFFLFYLESFSSFLVILCTN